MRALRFLALALACSLLGPVHASATPMSTETFIDTATFTIFDLTGPLAGNTYSGSFSWSPYDTTKLTAFSTDFPSWVDAVSNHGATVADFIYDYPIEGELALSYAPPPDGNPDAFIFIFYSDVNEYFEYGTTYAPGLFGATGTGSASFGPTVLTGTPEPGTLILMATGLTGTIGMVRRRLKA